MTRPSSSFVGLGCFVAAVAIGCGPTEPFTVSSVDQLAASYPAAASLLDSEGRRQPERTSDGFMIRPETSPARAGSDLSVEVIEATGALRVTVGMKGSFLVRRSWATPATARADERAVTIPGPGTGDTAFLFSRPRGVEELVLRSQPSELRLAMDLPSGWTLRQRRDAPWIVDVLATSGAPVVRLASRVAWDLAGRALEVESRVEGSTVSLKVDSDGPVLIDPEWQAAGQPAYPRAFGSMTLLHDGKVLLAGGLEGQDGKPQPNSELYDPRAGTYEPGPRLQTVRWLHAAVLLASGRVLVVGGLNGDSEALASAEEWDPSGPSPDFEEVMPPGLQTARFSFSATLLANGQVLVAGGGIGGLETAQPTKSAELYDPKAKVFNTTSSPLNTARGPHTATLLQDGRVLFVGGTFAPTDTAEVYTTGDVFEPLGPVTSRQRHLALSLADGRVLIAGGAPGETSPLAPEAQLLTSAEVFDPLDDTFTPVGDMVAGRLYPAGALLSDGRVLIAGGDGELVNQHLASTELFDPLQATFENPPPPDMLNATATPTVAMLPTADAMVSATQLFDPGNREATVIAGAALGSSHVSSTSTLLPSGKLLLVGSYPSNPADAGASSVETYQAGASATEPAADLIVPRGYHAATLLFDGSLLITGGYAQGTSETLSSVERYARGAFSAAGSTLQARAGHTSTLLADGRVLVACGLVREIGGAEVTTATTEIFDPQSGESTPGPTLPAVEGRQPQGRWGHTATRLPDGRVLLAGGFAGSDSFTSGELSDAYLYDHATGTVTDVGQAMVEARALHTATALLDGRVLLAGGSVNGLLEIFDPNAPSDQRFQATGPGNGLGQKRLFAAAVRLLSGKVLFTGGKLTGSTKIAEDQVVVFDPDTNALELGNTTPGEVTPGTLVQPLSNKRWWHTASLLPDGSVAVVGGYQNESQIQNNAVRTFDVIVDDPNKIASNLRPNVTGDIPFRVKPGDEVKLTGERFTGVSKGTTGRSASASNGPIAYWVPLDGAPVFGGLVDWSPSSATWRVPATAYPGPGLLFVVSHGLHSTGRMVVIDPLVNGAACHSAGACGSGFCVDGVCCDTACEPAEGPRCLACSAAAKGQGADGVCEPVKRGEDPHNACEPSNVCEEAQNCDGNGACIVCTACDEAECNKHGFVCGAQGCPTKCITRLDCVEGLTCRADGVCDQPPVDDPAGICTVAWRPNPPPTLPIAAGACTVALAVWRRRRRSRGRLPRRRARLPALTDRRPLGRGGLRVAPFCLGIVDRPQTLCEAFDAGINFFLLPADMHWPIYEPCRKGLRMLLRRSPAVRDEIVVAVESFVSRPWLCRGPFRQVLRAVPELGRIDVTLAGAVDPADCDQRLEIHNDQLREGFVGVRGAGALFHDRRITVRAVNARSVDIAFVSYHAGLRQARADLFPKLRAGKRPLLYTFNSTRPWIEERRRYRELGLSSAHWRPHPTDYYRFALTCASVDGLLICLRKARYVRELADALARGPVDDEEENYLMDLADLAQGNAVLADEGAGLPS